MQIGEVMTRNVVTVGPRDTIAIAREKLRAHRIHHLLVVAAGRVIGALSVREVIGRTDDQLVSDVMLHDVVTTAPDTTLRDAAKLMIGRKSGCLPIVQDGRVAGIITTTDLLRLLSAPPATVSV